MLNNVELNNWFIFWVVELQFLYVARAPLGCKDCAPDERPQHMLRAAIGTITSRHALPYPFFCRGTAN